MNRGLSKHIIHPTRPGSWRLCSCFPTGLLFTYSRPFGYCVCLAFQLSPGSSFLKTFLRSNVFMILQGLCTSEMCGALVYLSFFSGVETTTWSPLRTSSSSWSAGRLGQHGHQEVKLQVRKEGRQVFVVLMSAFYSPSCFTFSSPRCLFFRSTTTLLN